MKVFGWLLTIVGGGLAFYGAFIGNQVYGGPYVGSHRVMHMPSIMFGGLMLIVGAMMLIASKFGNKNTEETASDSKLSGIFNGIAYLENDAYKIYLTKRYDINFNNALNKYISSDKLFDNIDEALAYAKEIDWAQFNIVNGIVHAKHNADGGVVCPVCNTPNNTERVKCRECQYELIVDSTNTEIVEETVNNYSYMGKILFVVVLLFSLVVWLISKQ